MIYLKNILSILIIFFYFENASSHDQIDFEPLKTLESERPNTSKGKLNHMFKFSLRCSALLYSLGKETDNNKIIPISRNFNQSAYVALLLIKKKNADALRNQVSEYIKEYIKIYTPILKNNFSKNNKYIEGSDILEGEQKKEERDEGLAANHDQALLP